MLYVGGPAALFANVALIVLLMMMDTVDGVLARRLGQQTLVGSVLDIAADRAVEVVLWVVYAHLQLILVAIPIIFVVRGALTDSIRSVAFRRGLSAHTMMSSKVGRWLVASSAMRVSIQTAKTFAFGFLALALALRSAEMATYEPVWVAGRVMSWVAVAIHIVRGVPVLAEARTLFQTSEAAR
jgi:CDP-diacylglycerol--glycerol-3-phosphate 3-phosphatidyltransferase